ncbi:hypothetical protein NEOC84_001784|nr:hypothetical protein [Neochlamydia sp. AcF84]
MCKYLSKFLLIFIYYFSMNRIKKYCSSFIQDKKGEPNRSMGKAIFYLYIHGEGFILFLRIPEVPLTNNIAG